MLIPFAVCAFFLGVQTNEQSFRELRHCMTEDAVFRILGKPTEVKEQWGPIVERTCIWRRRGGYIQVTFNLLIDDTSSAMLLTNKKLVEGSHWWRNYWTH